MYRKLMTVLLYAGTVLSAPQENSNITYVKKYKSTEIPAVSRSTQESKIENLTLTIPTAFKEPEYFESLDEVESVSQSQPKKDLSKYNYSDRIYSIKSKPNKKANTTKTEKRQQPEPTSTENINLNHDSDNSTLKYDTFTENEVFTTEEVAVETTTQTTVTEETTKAFLNLPENKITYSGLSKFGAVPQNLIGYSGKRRFRSRCKCEKIWNCVKIQISVPRCPDEYFYCCL